MPVGDLPGWHQVFADDFGSTQLDSSKWGAYSGPTSGDQVGWWAPSHVVVSGCMATLRGYMDAAARPGVFVGGGIGMKAPHAQTYGKYEVRMRVDKGDGISAIALLWPKAPVWPPEVDFFEDGGGPRTSTTATWHCSPNGSNTCWNQKSLSSYDFSQWHTVGVEWTSGRLVYTIDGNAWASISDPGVPSIPMWLGIQTQSLQCSPNNTCLSPATPREVDMQTDWVSVYSPA